ncbi:hypothetical protein RFI_39485 [Reticulomyxa filosa]|uniref:Uncharacterized protein n=1 Tax=Reticulomyxa filosa TaxID=46433 RepID=X6L943_RETFI|nr:hypothetical protein RFI_39485 [Reticulomyxa filosa]|eukprot:ETN98038.1 hypothetical protein RFI_39485 [Reticulomyxa filosa]
MLASFKSVQILKLLLCLTIIWIKKYFSEIFVDCAIFVPKHNNLSCTNEMLQSLRTAAQNIQVTLVDNYDNSINFDFTNEIGMEKKGKSNSYAVNKEKHLGGMNQHNTRKHQQLKIRQVLKVIKIEMNIIVPLVLTKIKKTEREKYNNNS